ncbi:MAG: hypothetical protein RMZ43_007200 [Nostoc sp. CmiVER01]|nr:hypothetical protein [Nostoc sp. CmiVER01]MDZ8125694.1 hypothetical protein [Nostoc sp. CmiVER01]
MLLKQSVANRFPKAAESPADVGYWSDGVECWWEIRREGAEIIGLH